MQFHKKHATESSEASSAECDETTPVRCEKNMCRGFMVVVCERIRKAEKRNKTQATWFLTGIRTHRKRFRKGSFVKTSVWLSLTPWLDVLRVARWPASMSTKRIRTTTTQQKRKRKRKEEEEEDEAEHHQEYTSTTRARTTWSHSKTCYSRNNFGNLQWPSSFEGFVAHFLPSHPEKEIEQNFVKTMQTA